MSRAETAEVTCKSCGAILKEKTDIQTEDRVRCPQCGSKERNIVVRVHNEIKVRTRLRAMSYPPNSKKFTMDVMGGDYQSNDGNFVKKSRVIDRPKDVYSEKVIDENGNVLRDVTEKLSEHKGHGSAKFNKKKKCT